MLLQLLHIRQVLFAVKALSYSMFFRHVSLQFSLVNAYEIKAYLTRKSLLLRILMYCNFLLFNRVFFLFLPSSCEVYTYCTPFYILTIIYNILDIILFCRTVMLLHFRLHIPFVMGVQ